MRISPSIPIAVMLLLSVFSFTPANAGTKPNMPGSMRFSAYTGFDAYDWETSVGALADTTYDLPMYRGWPHDPYVVIGDIRHKDPKKRWKEGEFKKAISGAKSVGGQAIVIRHGSEAGVHAITGTQHPNIVYAQAETTALVIRWQTRTEVEARRQRDLALIQKARDRHPNMTASEQTGALAVKYLLRKGISDSTPDFPTEFITLVKGIQRTNDALAGQWLFKATVKTSGIVDRNERSHLGIASVRVDPQGIAIISVEGETELSFSGTQTGGRIAGQIGIANHSIRAEGVASPDKISLTFQTVVQNGTVQGTLVLQR